MALDDQLPLATAGGLKRGSSKRKKSVSAGRPSGAMTTASAMPRSNTLDFPFAAIVGQDELKTALLLTAIDPTIGGVLALGDRGTGKSTAVRALAGLLPPIEVISGCAYGRAPGIAPCGCDGCAAIDQGAPATVIVSPVPMIELPLGATEDRVVGALNIERALVDGVKAFEPGLLARANRGYLYIDEVNLLEDHLVDLLIDVAASGENIVERDGLSVRHPARFVLIGSGNPEEGELRPQLLDRFGLSAEVKTPTDIALRVEIVKRRDAFDRDRAAFCEAWHAAGVQAGKQIIAARQRLPKQELPDECLEAAAQLCVALGSDGLRGELTLIRTARALACLNADVQVRLSHIKAVAPMCLRHRLRRNPLDDAGSTVRIERAMTEAFGS